MKIISIYTKVWLFLILGLFSFVYVMAEPLLKSGVIFTTNTTEEANVQRVTLLTTGNARDNLPLEDINALHIKKLTLHIKYKQSTATIESSDYSYISSNLNWNLIPWLASDKNSEILYVRGLRNNSDFFLYSIHPFRQGMCGGRSCASYILGTDIHIKLKTEEIFDSSLLQIKAIYQLENGQYIDEFIRSGFLPNSKTLISPFK